MNDAPARAGALAALLWVLFTLRWFDVGAPWRPAGLAAVPPWVLLAAFLAALGVWLRGRWTTLRGEPLGPMAGGLALVMALAFFFRLPSPGAAPARPSGGQTLSASRCTFCAAASTSSSCRRSVSGSLSRTSPRSSRR
jgi:hypothetical protein